MKLSDTLILYVKVKPLRREDLKSFQEAFNKLAVGDPLVYMTIEDVGAVIRASMPDHLEPLKEKLSKSVEIVTEGPFVSYRETINEESPKCKVVTPNKENTLYVSAVPVLEGVIDELYKGNLSSGLDDVERNKILVNAGMSKEDAHKVFSMGPTMFGQIDATNLLSDGTAGVKNINEIKVIESFMETTFNGVLCGEPMAYVNFRLDDATLSQDKIKRGPSQIIPAIRKAMYTAFLAASPRLLEPIYRLEIQCTDAESIKLMGCLAMLRARIIETEGEGDNVTHSFIIPAAQCFSLGKTIADNVGRELTFKLTLDHWGILYYNIFEYGSSARSNIELIRLQKGMFSHIPVDRYSIDA
eukprot:gene12258-14366_t